MAKSSRKAAAPAVTENEAAAPAAVAVPKKKAAALQQMKDGFVHSVEIRTKGNHNDFIAWYLDQMPGVYHWEVVPTEFGVKISMGYEGKEQDPHKSFFIGQYLGMMIMQVKSFDEHGFLVQRYDRPHPELNQAPVIAEIRNTLASESTLVE